VGQTLTTIEIEDMEIIRASELIREEWLPEYEKQREIIHGQLVGLNTYLFTLERIEEFPFRVFFPAYDDRIFWQTTRNALVEIIVIRMWRIGVDRRKDVLTLKNFKDDIWANLKDNTAGQIFQGKLEHVDFDNQIQTLNERLTELRHNYFAHFNKSLNLTPKPEKIANIAVSLSDFKNFIVIIRKLFDVLCFEHHHDLWLWAYSQYRRENQETDVDKLLDGVARNSDLLNLPETAPDIWTGIVAELSDYDLAIINKYRLKFRLPSVDRQ
jgi:hypothetical protein